MSLVVRGSKYDDQRVFELTHRNLTALDQRIELVHGTYVYHPGAGSTAAPALVAKSPPDGYTLLVNTSAQAYSAVFVENLPYNPLKDFIPVAPNQPALRAGHRQLVGHHYRGRAYRSSEGRTETGEVVFTPRSRGHVALFVRGRLFSNRLKMWRLFFGKT
jgi:Tripartite tricarboxylate transporter family receptor